MSIFTNPQVIPEAIALPKAHNFMSDIVFNGCARPWYIYVETAGPAFLNFFFTILLIQLDDIARAYGEHMSTSRGSGSRKKGTARRSGRIDVRETTSQKVGRQGLKTVLKVTAPLEAAGFAFLLWSAADEFYGDWQTLIEAAPFCTNPPNLGPLSRTDPDPLLTIRETGQAFGYDTLEQNRGNWNTSVFSCQPETGPLFFSATLKGVAGPAGVAKAALRIRVIINGKNNDFDSDFVSAGPNQKVEFVVTGRKWSRIFDSVNLRWEMVGQTQLNAVRPTEGDVFVTIEKALSF